MLPGRKRERSSTLKRLVYSSIPQERINHFPRKLLGLTQDRIHAIIDTRQYLDIKKQAIEVQISVRRDVEEQNIDNWMMWGEEYFSFFQERFAPPLDDLLANLPK